MSHLLHRWLLSPDLHTDVVLKLNPQVDSSVSALLQTSRPSHELRFVLAGNCWFPLHDSDRSPRPRYCPSCQFPRKPVLLDWTECELQSGRKLRTTSMLAAVAPNETTAAGTYLHAVISAARWRLTLHCLSFTLKERENKIECHLIWNQRWRMLLVRRQAFHQQRLSVASPHQHKSDSRTSIQASCWQKYGHSHLLTHSTPLINHHHDISFEFYSMYSMIIGH